MPDWEDMTVFDEGEFASQVTAHPGEDDERQFGGVFRAPHQAVDLDHGVGLSTDAPRLSTASANLSDLDQGDLVAVDSVTYQIIDIRPDGSGRSVLILQEVG